jgi:RHS repeat-associated protein
VNYGVAGRAAATEYASTFGFYEYRARAYNPTLGRFMSEDPKLFVRRIGLGKSPDNWSFSAHLDQGEFNLLRYCSNDPLDKTDPMGLSEIDIEITRTESVIQAHSGVPQATMGNFKMTVSGSSHSFDSVSSSTRVFMHVPGTPSGRTQRIERSADS